MTRFTGSLRTFISWVIQCKVSLTQEPNKELLCYTSIALMLGTVRKAVILTDSSISLGGREWGTNAPLATSIHSRLDYWWVIRSYTSQFKTLAFLSPSTQPHALQMFAWQVASCTFLQLCVNVSVYMCIYKHKHSYTQTFFFFQVEFLYTRSLPWQQKREFRRGLEVPTSCPVTDPWIEPSLHLCLKALWLSWSFNSNTSSSWRSRNNTSSRFTWTK